MPVKNDVLGYADVPVMEEEIALSDFQRRVVMIPEEWNVALTGSRGGGKSHLMAILILRFIIKYGHDARVLFVRQSHAGCEDFVSICRGLFGMVWGAAVTYNANQGIWRGFPGGGTVEISQLSNHGEYAKFQGRSFSLICCDEAGQFPTSELIDLLRSNLRGPASVPKRIILASNPCGVGHIWLYKRHVLAAPAWTPYSVDGATWVTAPSLFTENPFIDVAQYKRDLEAACSFDQSLLLAFRDGRWDQVRGGAYFGNCLNQDRVMFKDFLAKIPKGVTLRRWLRPPVESVGSGVRLEAPDLDEPRFWISLDWGYSAPAVCQLMMWSPGMAVGGRWYSRGSILILDEVSTARPGQVHVGSELSVDDVAVLIKDMWRRWGLGSAPHGVADDACGIRNDKGISILDEFARCNVYFVECQKGGRVAGWTHMREMLYNASLERVDKPGLFVSSRCGYWWETVPFLSRSQRHPEDLEGVADHSADCTRYGLLNRMNPRPATEIRI